MQALIGADQHQIQKVRVHLSQVYTEVHNEHYGSVVAFTPQVSIAQGNSASRFGFSSSVYGSSDGHWEVFLFGRTRPNTNSLLVRTWPTCDVL
mmetsp:Transcript_2674/g.6152  ORF Transcript_2674/g.6152 Transcript_2674/m.6152 type:complete len:93 (+) Transcript_2674:823-1101(+)